MIPQRVLVLSCIATYVIGFSSQSFKTPIIHTSHHHKQIHAFQRNARTQLDLFGFGAPSDDSTATSPEQRQIYDSYSVELVPPLGIILQERNSGGGVAIHEITNEGAVGRYNAESRTKNERLPVVIGDVLLQVNDQDVSTMDFDSVMECIVEASSSPSIQLTLGDGLGQLNMPKNVVSQLQSTSDAFLVDAVVRQAAREIRQINGPLGTLVQVEVVVGAGVREDERVMVRFFGIFSTDGGVTTYSCNVAATGRQVAGSSKDEDQPMNRKRIEITSLSCAKDEGLGRTFDLIVEEGSEKDR